jgi:O-antigen/teichoic acid export membrane protein
VSILAAVSRLGADTGLVWALPRARALDRPLDGDVALVSAQRRVLAASLALAVGLAVVAPVAADWMIDPPRVEELTRLLRIGAAGVAFAAPFMVAAAALRGFGSVGAFTLMQNVGLPLARVALVVVAVVSAASVGPALVAWVAPLPVAYLVTREMVRRRRVAASGASEAVGSPADGAADPGPPTRFWAFCAARWLAAQLEVVIVWADVIIVSALTSAEVAGIYAAASRFVTAGTLVEAAMRVALAPQFSALLAAGRIREVERLHGLATRWIVALAWPLYLGLAVMAPFALGLFGPSFAAGAGALSVLSLAMAAGMCAGTSHTVLLMSGQSRAQVATKALALVTNLGLNLALVPRFGLSGAAAAWAVTILLDAVVVVAVVRLRVGVRLPVAPLALVAGVAGGCFGFPLLGARLLWGTGAPVALGACLTCAAALLAVMHVLRRHYDLAGLRGLLSASRADVAVTAE